MLGEIKVKLNKYLDDDDVLVDYSIDEKLLIDIFDHVKKQDLKEKNKISYAIIYYLLTEAFRYHDNIEENDSSIAKRVILGDYFGILFHKASIDLKENKLNEILVSEYKKMCIDAFNGKKTNPLYENIGGSK